MVGHIVTMKKIILLSWEILVEYLHLLNQHKRLGITLSLWDLWHTGNYIENVPPNPLPSLYILFLQSLTVNTCLNDAPFNLFSSKLFERMRDPWAQLYICSSAKRTSYLYAAPLLSMFFLPFIMLAVYSSKPLPRSKSCKACS